MDRALERLKAIAQAVQCLPNALQPAAFEYLLKLEPCEGAEPVLDVQADGGSALAAGDAPPRPGRRSPRRAAPRNGTSARARVEALADEGFFTEPRLTTEVTEVLVTRGHHYESRRVSMALLEVCRKGKLRRMPSGRQYRYVNP